MSGVAAGAGGIQVGKNRIINSILIQNYGLLKVRC